MTYWFYIALVSPSLEVNTESVITGELMAGAGGQREHLAVGTFVHVESLLMVHRIFPMARVLSEAWDTAVTLGLVTSLMVQTLVVKL